MDTSLFIQHDVSLRCHNTFGIDARAKAYVQLVSAEMLPVFRARADLAAMPRLLLGGGSNVLLTGDFPGLVLHVGLKGIQIVGEDAGAVYVRAGAGENWHGLVQWTLERGLAGLENLSLIPGSVGAAPTQNIGAYGVELKERFHTLSAYDLSSGRLLTLDRDACRFGYRDSIFKHELRDHVLILDVTFALPKKWEPNIDYAELRHELAARGVVDPDPVQISQAVIAIRQRKLPDPSVIGNAGSFFKNPLVSAEKRDALLSEHPQLVSYLQPGGQYKLAAGWLIDQCGWKGKTLGRAGVYEKQALVLVNRGGADGQEVVALARAIQADVMQRFGIWLEPEPVFV